MSGCVNIALRDILAGSAAGGYGCQPLKAGGAAQPKGCSACFVRFPASIIQKFAETLLLLKLSLAVIRKQCRLE